MLFREVGEKTPLVVVCAGTCLGILVSARDLDFVLFCLLLISFMVRRRTILPLALGFILGYAAMSAAPREPVVREGDHQVAGRVEEAGFAQGTFRMVLADVAVDGQEMRGRALLRGYENVRQPCRGCSVRCTARLKPWQKAGNRGEFDYRTYMLTQGITVSGYIKDFDTMAVSGQGRDDPLRSRLAAFLDGHARPEAEILKAALTGDRSGLVNSLQDSFSALGTAHLIAISGLNMGVVFLLGYSGAFLAMRLLPFAAGRFDTPLAARMAGLACVLMYTWFVGYSPPAARAAIMVCAAAVSLLMARRPSLMESLAMAGIVILVWMPWSLYSASFLLSFSAVIGIIGISDRLGARPGWLMIPAIPLVSAAFTAPMVMYLFGFVSPVGIPANILFVPWFSFVVMPLGLAGILALPLSEGVSSLLMSLAFDGISLMLRASEAFGSLEPVPRPGMLWVMACYAGLITSFFGRLSVLRTAVLAICTLFIAGLPFVSQAVRSNRGLEFDVINVGQADSILVTKGTHALLIDAGSSYPGLDSGRLIVGPHLLSRGITRLDLVIMTHSHPDHIGGMPFILERFEVGEVWTNTAEDRAPVFQSSMDIARKKAIPVRCVCLGDVRDLGGIQVQVLSPPARIMTVTGEMDLNLNSVVVRAGDDGMRGLFMADSWGLGEIRLSRLRGDISADVLKVAHHGSKGSCIDMFLERARPSIAIIQVGRNNLYKLPHRRALQRLHDRNISIFRTDAYGEVTAFRDKRQLRVKSGLFPADTMFYGAAKCAR